MNSKLNPNKTASLAVALAVGALSNIALAQEKLATNVVNHDKQLNTAINLNGHELSSVTKRDTVECLFHQMINDSRPLLTWKRGYIVLENDQIRLGELYYPRSQASALTGLIQNKFLASNKKTAVKKKVVQVVLLQ